MTALKFQTGGRHQTSPASLRGEQTKPFHSLSDGVGVKVRVRSGLGLVRLIREHIGE